MPLVEVAKLYDLRSKADREHVREELRQLRPKLLVSSPPCTKFSPLQILRAHPERLADELPDAISHLEFSMELQKEQLQRGGHGHSLSCVQEYLANDLVKLVKSHLCRFGLQVGALGLNKKSP